MARARIDGAEAFVAGRSFHKHNIITDGVTIYSYGSHFPMARKTDGGILVNTDRYSPTTGQHQSALRGILAQHGYSPSGEFPDVHGRWTFELWTRGA